MSCLILLTAARLHFFASIFTLLANLLHLSIGLRQIPLFHVLFGQFDCQFCSDVHLVAEIEPKIAPLALDHFLGRARIVSLQPEDYGLGDFNFLSCLQDGGGNALA